MKKRVLKKSVKKFIYISVITIILLIISISLIKYYTGNLYKLTKLGYSKSEAKEIISLNKSNIVLSKDYNEKMIDIIKAKYYLEKNIDKYIEYYNEHKDISIEDVIAIINVHADSEFYTLNLEVDISNVNMLVNKYYYLGEYKPENLVNVKNWYAYGEQRLNKETYEAFINMFNAAKKEDLTIIINQGYRSYNTQVNTYKRYDDDYAAKAGYSEHQTGLAIDVITPDSDGETFDTTKEFAWLQNNAHKYGFILRYPKDKKYITGYEYESWHYRYLGTDLAKKVYESGLTYDEYYAYYLDK